jgi:hypothetical protein
METEFDHGTGLRFALPDNCALVYYDSDIPEALAQFQQESLKNVGGQERNLDRRQMPRMRSERRAFHRHGIAVLSSMRLRIGDGVGREARGEVPSHWREVPVFDRRRLTGYA